MEAVDAIGIDCILTEVGHTKEMLDALCLDITFVRPTSVEI